MKEPWDKHLRLTIKEQGVTADLTEPRFVEALKELADALERITTRKLSVLVGGAGTGKTTVLGALKKSQALARQGVLFFGTDGQRPCPARPKDGRSVDDGCAVPLSAKPLRRRSPAPALRKLLPAG